MTALLLVSFRLYFRALARLAPRIAGRQVYRLFCTPFGRRSVPSSVEGVMAAAERFDVDDGEHRVAAYRWGEATLPLAFNDATA